MKKLVKRFIKLIIFLLVLFLVLFLVYVYLAHPYKISGANVGRYKNQQTVISASPAILFLHSLAKGDVVIFQKSLEDEVLIGKIVKIPGEYIGDDKVFDLHNQQVNEGVIPNNSYLIQQETKDYSRVVSKDKIKGVVWWP